MVPVLIFCLLLSFYHISCFFRKFNILVRTGDTGRNKDTVVIAFLK